MYVTNQIDKIYNKDSHIYGDTVIISLFNGIGENRFRYTKFLTYSIYIADDWKCFSDIEFYLKKCECVIRSENDKKYFIIVGICKYANLALGLSRILSEKYTNKKFFPCGAPFLYDCDKGISPYCNNEYLSYTLKEFFKYPKIRSGIEKFGDARNLVYEGLRAYQIVPFNDKWDLDQNNVEKLGSYVQNTLILKVTNFYNNFSVHNAVLHFLKTNPVGIMNFFKMIVDDNRNDENTRVQISANPPTNHNPESDS